MKRRAMELAALVALCLALASPAFAQEKRVAFVIGNSSYPSAALANPANDAADVSAALAKLGFKVRTLVNANLRDMRQGLDEFARDAAGADFAIFYYAGHGVQAGGQSYLVPIDANLNAAADIEYDCVEVALVSAKLEGAKPSACAILLDACRDNPFRAGARSLERGLGVVARKPPESIIMYATGEGSTAADGTGRNGVFTASFLRNIARPGLDLWALGNAIRTDVKQATGDKQVPALYINLEMNRYYLAGRGDAQAATVAPVVAAAAPASDTPAGMVLIRGGTFTMGSLDSEPERLRDEVQHQVSVGSFYISATEVNQAEYEELLGTNPSEFRGATLPVESVTWFDAVNYCNARSMKEGRTPAYAVSGNKVTWNRSANGYRLPTEAEWEYACRAGMMSPFSTGGNITTQQANYDGNYAYDEAETGEYRETPLPVGRLYSNAWGLFDMHGNVAEWCWDWYKAYPTESQTDPVGPASGSTRVNRGGSWDGGPELLRSASRSRNAPGFRSDGLGFRVVCNQ